MTFKLAPYRYLFYFFALCITASASADWVQPPTLFPASEGFGTVKIASDANGNAALLISNNFGVDAYNYDSVTGWSGPNATFPADENIFFRLILAMDATGAALGAWVPSTTGTGEVAYYDGAAWSQPTTNPMLGSVVIARPAIAMNGSGEGVLVFIDQFGDVYASFFTGGDWGAPTLIATGAGSSLASVDYSTNGTVVAGWENNVGAPVAINYIGGIWNPQVILDTAGTYETVGIDASGKALAVWINAAGDVVYSPFNGSTWTSSQTIAAGPGNFNASVAMAPGGTAVAVFEDAAFNGFSSSYNGSTWNTPIQFNSDPLTSNSFVGPNLSVNSSGNALVVWATDAPEVKSAKLALGSSAWAPEEIIQDNPPSAIVAINGSLSDNGTGFATWYVDIDLGEGKAPFASVNLAASPPTPPVSIEGRSCKERFATQTNQVNFISFAPSTDPTVVAYYLRRNGVLIATIPAFGPYLYTDGNLCKSTSDTYSVTAVDADGVESTAVVVVL